LIGYRVAKVGMVFIEYCCLWLPNSSTLCFPFLWWKAWPQSQTDLFMCTMVLHCGHTFL